MTQEILSRVQKSFPLVERPFKAIADELGLSEDEVIAILNEEKTNKVIRQTSAIFDTKRLGYKSSLVAFDMDEDKIDAAVEIINSHPGISHNYERNHDFNIWFTLAVSPHSELGLEKTVELLAELTGANSYILLPTLKMFKISVKLDTTGKDSKKETVKKHKYKEIELSDLHYEVIKRAQKDIEIVPEPFKEMVEELGIGYDEFFEIMNEFQEAGVMRRYASILNHRKAGFNANAMVVWDVDEEKGAEIGQSAASFSAVSHCYLRPKYENWPFNLFTMVHGKTTEDTQSTIDAIADEIEFRSHMPLYSSREFKKVRITYFTPEFEAWEAQYKKHI